MSPNNEEVPQPRRALGVVLAGGRSSRLGVDKARLVLGGKELHQGQASSGLTSSREGSTLLLSAIERLLEVCPEVLVADRQRHLELYSHLERVVSSVEDGPGKGPLAGILGASRARPESSLLVLGCDLPKVSTRLLSHLLAVRETTRAEWTVARTLSGLEPLCAVYSPTALAKLEERAANHRYALYPLAEEGLLTVEVEAEESEMINLNTRADLERFESG